MRLFLYGNSLVVLSSQKDDQCLVYLCADYIIVSQNNVPVLRLLH